MDGCNNAIRRGDVESVKKILSEGLDVNQFNSRGVSPLMVACQNGRLDMIRLLLNGDAKVDLQNRKGWSVLMKAIDRNRVGSNHIEVVKLLLEYDPNLELKTTMGLSALTIAYNKRDMKMIELLVQKGVQVNDENLKSGLSLAIFSGNIIVSKLFLERGAEKSNVLTEACFFNNSDFVKALLETNLFQVNELDKSGTSALVKASMSGYCEVVQVLLDFGADIHLKDRSGVSALKGAVQMFHHETIKLLLEKGALVKTSEGATILMTAMDSMHGFSDSGVIKLLLDHGADVGKDALNFSINRNLVDILKLLVVKSTQVHLQEVVYQNNSVQVARLFIENLSEVNFRRNGVTPLMLYCNLGDLALAKLLLEKGAQVDLLDNSGRSALLYAARSSRYELVELLLQKSRESLTIYTDDGESVLNILQSNSHHILVSLTPNCYVATPCIHCMMVMRAGIYSSLSSRTYA